MKSFVSVFATLFIYVTAGGMFLQAQIPQTLSYQGVLTDSSGAPKPDGSYSFTFRLYETASGGAAIWSETENLAVKRGLFNTVLGDQNAFEPAVKFDRAYWLGIRVGNDPELSPRIPLTSVGYSFRAMRADTAEIAIISSGDSTWLISGANIYRLNGNVGIGTTIPLTKVHVAGETDIALRVSSTGSGSEVAALQINKNDVYWAMGTGGPGSQYGGVGGMGFRQSIGGVHTTRMVIDGNGNVGIGTTQPIHKLHVVGARFRLDSGAGKYVDLRTDGGAIDLVANGSPLTLASDDSTVIINPYSYQGNVGIGTWSPTAKLHVNGRTKTKVLEITGGADLAEPFEMSHPEPLPAGALVVIDKDNPGKLKQSTEPYDKRVAGVISGAGGVNPGLTLSQEGMLDSGQHVALSGKVYALASAANGPIEPGDLLTTSETPGYAMKATDYSRAQGAVIGKAMTGLENGEGLVLVLVNLQ